VILWRISNHTDLSGRGGMRAGGRWHSIGHPIVYLSEHPAGCLLETLAHGLGVAEVPSTYQWLEVAVDDNVATETVGELPDGWSQDVEVTRRVGDAWLKGRSSALLKVPSALAPGAHFLLNPRHAHAARVRVTRAVGHPADTRFSTPATLPAGSRRAKKKPISSR
jgi:RES domain-containing protein